jgi:hypothetical protein
MVIIAIMAAALVLEDTPPALEPAAEAPTYEVTFAPLPRFERRWSHLGPVGPFFPDKALRAKQGGEAILRCRVGAAQVLDQCEIVSDTPRGFGFAYAAVRLAEERRIRAFGEPGEGQSIRVRVPFALGAPTSIAPK